MGAAAARDPRPARDRVRRPGRQPARRPRAAPALRLPPAGRRARPPAAAAERLRDPGLHRPARHVAQPPAVRADDARAPRRAVRRRRVPGRDRRVRRRLDVVRRLAVPELERHRPLPRLPVRRDRRLRRRALPDGGEPRPPRPHRQVLGRLRRDGRADAPARRLRRARLARRRRALRGLLPARVPAGRPAAARGVRRLVGGVLRPASRIRRSTSGCRCWRPTATPRATRPIRRRRAARCCRSTSTGA